MSDENENETKDAAEPQAVTPILPLPKNIRGFFIPWNLLSHDEDPDWKVVRMGFTGDVTLVQPGDVCLITRNADPNLNTAAAAPATALAATDEAGIIVGVPQPEDTVAPPPTGAQPTVAVALTGSFNFNAVHIASARTTPILAASVSRLRDLGIFLDKTVPALAFAP